MLNRLLKLFESGRIDAAAIEKAVELSWITEEEKGLFKKEV